MYKMKKGLRVGQDHPGAKLTDHECEMIRQLSEGGMSYDRIADKFESPKATVAAICQYRRRVK